MRANVLLLFVTVRAFSVSARLVCPTPKSLSKGGGPRPLRAATPSSSGAMGRKVSAVARGGSAGGLAPAPLWGVLGVTAMLMNAVKRVLPAAAEPFSAAAAPLSPALWAAYGAVVVSMAYVEGYKAFHLKFSPMVVARSMTLETGSLAQKVLGPVYAMGLFHATKKRKATSWGFLVGVFGIVKLVKQLSYPWRAIVDGGVVAGLTIGSASILYHYVRALNGKAPPAEACLP